MIGGCDGTDPEREAYKDAMLSLPKSAVVITLGCAKFRLMGARKEMGNVPNEPVAIPRLLDAGQCNDSFSAVKTALALADLLKCGVNDLPLHLMVQWVEQKAVIVFLSLLYLGIKKINLGPKLPAYLTPNLVKYIVDNFELTTLGNNPFYMPPKPVIKAVPVSKPAEQELKSAPLREFEVT